jgi:hypothetical protein
MPIDRPSRKVDGMQIKWIFSSICSIALAACAPSQDAIHTAIVQTKAIEETSIAYTQAAQKIPLDEINLEELLILPGDLPTDYVGQQIKSELPKTLKDIGIYEGINTASQSFRNSHWPSEGVTITIYASAEEPRYFFDEILTKRLPKVEGLGDASLINEGGAWCDRCSIQIIFFRCNALVYIDILDQVASRDSIYGTITTYAKRLDERLQPLVC